MSEYIDKPNLYKSIVDREGEYRSALLKEENYNTATALQLQGLLNATTLIKHLVFDYPTVDAEPVVRCKDCKFWHTEGQYCDKFGRLWEEFYTSPNDYCSRGERREDGNN